MKRISLLLTWSVVAIAAQTIVAGTAMAAPSKEAIDQSILRALDEFQVPGMAVSVVYDGAVYYSGGEGLLTVDKKGLVDEATLFQIGSVSKAFTAAALALLVDQGKLNWDDKVIDYLPEFRMYDAWVTREFTIRDMLTHRSGLPLGAGDLLMFPEAKSTREEIVLAPRYLKPSSSFRAKFDYDNLMYIIAGEVVARISGVSFEDFLEQQLLQPLGMVDCFATLDRVPATATTATPHVVVEGKLQTTSSSITSVSSAAGGINCSASSMTKWMSFVLNKGLTGDGKQLISTAQVAELLNPVTLLPTPEYLLKNTGSFMNAYALGWNVSTFYGQPAYSHGGGVWGMTTFIMILPEQGLAVFASDNQLSAAPRAVVFDVVDQFARDGTLNTGNDWEGKPWAGKDWIAIISDLSKDRLAEGATAVEKAMAGRNADSKPSLPLDAYAGTYRDPWYGDIQVRMEKDGKLWFRSGRSELLTAPLEHFQYDTFIARWTEGDLNADAYVSFTLTPEGGIDRIRMKAVSPNTDFSFDFHDLDLKRVTE